jgi:hypothetical protein
MWCIINDNRIAQLSCSVLWIMCRNVKFGYVHKVWTYVQILYEILFFKSAVQNILTGWRLRFCVTDRFYEINVSIWIGRSEKKHNRINYLEITNKMRPCIRIYYSSVSYCSSCFERHIAHHQELRNCICILWFTYVCGCWPLSAAGNHFCVVLYTVCFVSFSVLFMCTCICVLNYCHRVATQLQLTL